MNTHLQPQPPVVRREGLGCFGKGCLILCLLFLFFLIAGAVGIYWGMKRHPEVVQGAFWASRTHILSDKPAEVPHFETTDEDIASAKQKWKAFDQATKREEPAQIELTADDLNNLIASNERSRGKAFVTIEGNQLHAKTSLPLGNYLNGTGLSGYYLNGEITVDSNGADSIAKSGLAAVTVNGKALPPNVLNWQYRNKPLHDYLGELQTTSVFIRDGKVILSRQAPPPAQP